MKKVIGLFALFLLSSMIVSAENWAQWRGPNRDGISQETGLLKAWAEALPVVWKAPIGEGYSAVSISGNALYTMDSRGQDEFVVAIDTVTGKEKWRMRIDSNYTSGQGDGPRSTP